MRQVECEQEGRHQKGCFLYPCYNLLKAKNMHPLYILKERRVISSILDRVVKAFIVAIAQDANYILLHKNEKASTSLFIYFFTFTFTFFTFVALSNPCQQLTQSKAIANCIVQG